MFGFMGKILRIDLSQQKFIVIQKGENFYQKYPGGAFLGIKLFEEEVAGSTDIGPFDAMNPLIFATGVFAGESICGATRVNVVSVSPETTGTYISQAGGEFGPALKRAGFDAIIITGNAGAPVYLKISTQGKRCSIDFVAAKHLWGKDRLKSNNILKEELKENYSLSLIGPAGENKVACANIMFEADHYAGRGGLGAVMGAKNLKAICVQGDEKPQFKNREKVFEINRDGARRFKNSAPDSFLGVLKNLGTFGLLQLNQDAGNLPTRNFKDACVQSEAMKNEMSHSTVIEKYVGKSNPCKACFISCKKKYKKDTPYAEWSSLAEYESIALLGPNLGLENSLEDGLKACELCNQLGVDTISIGNIVAWLMDCYENKILKFDQFDFEIRFGEGQQACELIEAIALRKGELGNLLADGVLKAVEVLGEATRSYLRAARGIGLPAHMPRKKPAVGFGYLHGPNPGDHMKLEHDWIAGDPDSLANFGLSITSEPDALDKNKVEIARITQIYYSLIDALSLCMFVFGPGNIYTFDEITEMVNAATGFNYSFQDLMKIGEQSIQLQRKIYTDFGGYDENFLEYLKEEIPSGPSKGNRISQKDFEISRSHYYSLWNWESSESEK